MSITIRCGSTNIQMNGGNVNMANWPKGTLEINGKPYYHSGGRLVVESSSEGYLINGRPVGSSGAAVEDGGDLNRATLQRVSLAPGAKIQLDSKIVDDDVTAIEIVNGVFCAVIGGDARPYPGVKNVEVLGDNPFGPEFVNLQAGGDLSIECGHVRGLHGSCDRVEVSGDVTFMNLTSGQVIVPSVRNSVETKSGRVTRGSPLLVETPASAMTLVCANVAIGAVRVANCKVVRCKGVDYVIMSHVGSFVVAGLCDGVKSDAATVFVQSGIVRDTVVTTSGAINLIKVGAARSISGCIQLSEVEDALTTSAAITVTKTCLKAASISGDICVPKACKNVKTHGFVTFLD